MLHTEAGQVTSYIFRFAQISTPHTRLFRKSVPSSGHWILLNLECICSQAENSLLWLVTLPPEESYHHSTLVESMEDLRNLCGPIQGHTWKRHVLRLWIQNKQLLHVNKTKFLGLDHLEPPLQNRSRALLMESADFKLGMRNRFSLLVVSLWRW